MTWLALSGARRLGHGEQRGHEPPAHGMWWWPCLHPTLGHISAPLEGQRAAHPWGPQALLGKHCWVLSTVGGDVGCCLPPARLSPTRSGEGMPKAGQPPVQAPSWLVPPFLLHCLFPISLGGSEPRHPGKAGGSKALSTQTQAFEASCFPGCWAPRWLFPHRGHKGVVQKPPHILLPPSLGPGTLCAAPQDPTGKVGSSFPPCAALRR